MHCTLMLNTHIHTLIYRSFCSQAYSKSSGKHIDYADATLLGVSLMIPSQGRSGTINGPGLWLGPAQSNRCAETRQ